MNIEAYDLDSLRDLVRKLQKENRRLKQQLKQAAVPYDEQNIFDEKCVENEYDPDQGARIMSVYISEKLANHFFGMFWGRMDVFAKRGSKGGYFPQCENRWNSRVCPKQYGKKQSCEDCEYRSWTKLTPKMLVDHLLGCRDDGADVLGVYPLFPDGTCRFLVFDFDNHEKGAAQTDYANEGDDWRSEVDALRKICLLNGLTPLVERSRSGRGAHLWLFFKSPVSAAKARNFGFLLLEKGELSVNLRSFRYYDRMYPSQDEASGLGNLIALPLQGRALKEGNSAFVDENWNAYPDQWKILLQDTRKIDRDEIDLLMAKWQSELAADRYGTVDIQQKNRRKPWERNTCFKREDVSGKVHIVLGDGLYIDALNLMPRMQNQIREMAVFTNPVFEKNKKLGYSNFYNDSTIYLGKDIDGYIQIPRGLRDDLESRLKSDGIPYDMKDEREKGRPIRVTFNGDLMMRQQLAAQRMLSFDNGVLSAATAFGKTVVCSYLIAERKVSTLILLQNKDLMEQWISELERFLTIKEDPPKYKTKSGREKQRAGVIGCLSGAKNTLTGIVDVAMVGSLYAKGKFNDLINSYGLVIMDECHHCGSDTSVAVMEKVNARFVYGVSATPQRSDQLEKIIYMLLGPVRYSYTAKERSVEQGIGHFVNPRFSRVRDSLSDNNINAAYTLICSDRGRNDMIIEDTKKCVENGRTPVILTRYKEHAAYLYENLKSSADHVFILYGDNSDRENNDIRRKLKEVPAQSSLILVATGQKIGEGFDCPRLDTLMLAAPVSFSGRLEQYLGRLNRDYAGKQDVIVYDYIDFHFRVFDNMYQKRLRTYRKIGFEVMSAEPGDRQQVNSIFDRGNYSDIFERDLTEAESRIIISSPELVWEKVDRLVYLVRPRQEAGCKVTVITKDPQEQMSGSFDFSMELITILKEAGVQVIVRADLPEHFAVIDTDLVWHGGMNLLGKEDAWDNLMRVHSAEIAGELLEIAFLADR